MVSVCYLNVVQLRINSEPLTNMLEDIRFMVPQGSISGPHR